MTVYLILGALGAVSVLAIVAAIFWALTRAPDRLQMATGCLFVCGVLYFLGATQIYTTNASQGLLLGGYALLVYGVVGALAMFRQPWAWRASIAAFAIHTSLTLALAFLKFHAGGGVWLALLFSSGFGVLGLYAALHQGSRQLVFNPQAAGSDPALQKT